jgi:hypothetical protein
VERLRKKVEGTGLRQVNKWSMIMLFGVWAEQPRQGGLKLELPRATLAPYANELVSSQLSFQLPQNPRPKGKGNWPSEMGQLQSFAGCPISGRCDMINKRARKSKSSIDDGGRCLNGGLEVHLSYSKGYVKAREGEACRLRSRPSRHRTQLLLLSP